MGLDKSSPFIEGDTDLSQQPSIEDSYERGILSATHALTAQDLQDMLDICDTQQIMVIPFDIKSVSNALALMKKDNAEVADLYVVPFLLSHTNKNEQGDHWLAATVSVNPLTREILYAIDDSVALSASEIQDYKNIMEAAIKQDEAFSDKKGWTITDAFIEGDASQTDAYSSGYRALHRLFQDPAIRGDSLAAYVYSESDALSSEKLVESFFQQRLQDDSVHIGGLKP
jgi:hypothetical protein